METDFLASENRFRLLRVEVETATEVNGNQFLKKDRIVTNENWFLG